MKIKEYRNKDRSYTLPNQGEFLSGLKKVNIFVGANNSGKSRFMRQIFKAAHDDLVFFDDVNEELKKIHTELEPQFQNLFYMADLKSLINSNTGDYISRFNEFVHKIETKTGRSSGMGNIWDLDVALAIRNQMSNRRIPKKLEGKFNAKIRHVYIPILRGLRHLDPTSDKSDVYTTKTTNDYRLNEGGNGNNDIFSGLTIYSESKRMLLGSKKERQFVRDFEKFISESFFANKSVTLIPDHDTDNIKLNINDGEEDREIYNLGDGVQSILIATFKVFQHQDEEVILFIEEPEMMMHPAMQRVLVETLINKFPRLQVFLTTHSNHFLDLTYDYPGDVAVFSFEEIEREQFEIKNIGNNVKILDLLGIRNSSVFLSNCVIWTEGVTDRMLLRKLLELNPDFKYTEDRHYAFAEYGGSNLENFDFVEVELSDGANISAISRRNYIVIDNDKEDKGKRFDRRQNLKKVLGDDHVFDSHIEIENLIPYKVWNPVLKKLLQNHPNKGIQLKDTAKNIESKFNESLATKKIGQSLKMLIEQKEGIDNAYFQSSNVQCLGEPKKVIAKYIVDAIDEMEMSLSDFPQVTKDLVIKLKNFVDSANGRD